jgi:hypothetical protein
MIRFAVFKNIQEKCRLLHVGRKTNDICWRGFCKFDYIWGRQSRFQLEFGREKAVVTILIQNSGEKKITDRPVFSPVRAQILSIIERDVGWIKWLPCQVVKKICLISMRSARVGLDSLLSFVVILDERISMRPIRFQIPHLISDQTIKNILNLLS